MQFQSFSPTAQQLDSFRKGRKSFACTKKGTKIIWWFLLLGSKQTIILRYAEKNFKHLLSNWKTGLINIKAATILITITVKPVWRLLLNFALFFALSEKKSSNYKYMISTFYSRPTLSLLGRPPFFSLNLMLLQLRAVLRRFKVS